MENDFCIFIISHGRPEVLTYKTLIKAGCTLPIYIIIDNHDKTADEYFQKYKDIVYMFNKDKYAKMTDNYDNFEDYRASVHARNACFDIAKELGYKYFLVLDDDYAKFNIRINSKLEYPERWPTIKKIDKVLLATLEYFKNSNFTSICYSQGGDWFGGKDDFNKKPKRKAINSFFCSVDRRFWFVGRLNEDVNTYMSLGHQGHVFLTIPFISIDVVETQKIKGGLTETYIKNSTYVKSFYTILCRPDCVKINLMGVVKKTL